MTVKLSCRHSSFCKNTEHAKYRNLSQKNKPIRSWQKIYFLESNVTDHTCLYYLGSKSFIAVRPLSLWTDVFENIQPLQGQINLAILEKKTWCYCESFVLHLLLIIIMHLLWNLNKGFTVYKMVFWLYDCCTSCLGTQYYDYLRYMSPVYFSHYLYFSEHKPSHNNNYFNKIGNAWYTVS